MTLGFSLGLQFAYLLGTLGAIVVVLRRRTLRALVVSARPVAEATAIGVGVLVFG